jgi:hypothetical protein
MTAFQRVPAVVSTFDDQVHLFKTVLTYVPGPEVAILPVECESPRIPKPIGPNLPSGVRGARKGVVALIGAFAAGAHEQEQSQERKEA